MRRLVLAILFAVAWPTATWAECAWILWHHSRTVVGMPPEYSYPPAVIDSAYETRPQCLTAARQRAEDLKQRGKGADRVVMQEISGGWGTEWVIERQYHLSRSQQGDVVIERSQYSDYFRDWFQCFPQGTPHPEAAR